MIPWLVCLSLLAIYCGGFVLWSWWDARQAGKRWEQAKSTALSIARTQEDFDSARGSMHQDGHCQP